MTREITDKLLELVDEGMLDARTVLLEALVYMSEDDVADMARCAGFVDEEDEEEESYTYTDEDEVNDAFENFYAGSWEDLPAVRVSFSFFVDNLERNGEISPSLADSVTLRNDD